MNTSFGSYLFLYDDIPIRQAFSLLGFRGQRLGVMMRGMAVGAQVEGFLPALALGFGMMLDVRWCRGRTTMPTANLK
jgi:hypothetical protein